MSDILNSDNTPINASASHGTLVAATVATVTLGPCGRVEVLGRSGTAEIYFTVDGSTPTVGGAGTYVVPASIFARRVSTPGGATVTVKLISSGTPTYTVTAL